MAKFAPGKMTGGLVFLALVSLLMGWLISNSALITGAILVLILAGIFLMLQAWHKVYPADFIIVEKFPNLLIRHQGQPQDPVLNLNKQPNSKILSPAEPPLLAKDPPCRAVREAEEIARATYERLYGKYHS